jgi:antitoxin MazE
VKWGNSLALRIPKPVAEEAGFPKAIASLSKPKGPRSGCGGGSRACRLRELVLKITAENRYEAIRSGPDRGKGQIEW